jgi:hypothetical protein
MTPDSYEENANNRGFFGLSGLFSGVKTARSAPLAVTAPDEADNDLHGTRHPAHDIPGVRAAPGTPTWGARTNGGGRTRARYYPQPVPAPTLGRRGADTRSAVAPDRAGQEAAR